MAYTSALLRGPLNQVRQRITLARNEAARHAMASYVEDALIKDERIVRLGRISLWSLWHLIALGLLLLPVFGLGLVFWMMAYVRYKSTELAITTKRIIVKHGFIRRRTIEININKVESIQVDQEILGRMFNFGTLLIAGAGNPQAPVSGISAPMEFRKAFIEVQDHANAG
jgi:uncharacterized membrane protein YdbT with pleckstrin-like domain